MPTNKPNELQTHTKRVELHRSALVRGLYLPTTPFVLLAAACFARSSDRFYNAMLNHRIAGPIIADWREHHAMRRKTKQWAALMMVLSFGTSILVVPTLQLQLFLLGMALVLGLFIWRVPVRPE